MKYVAACLVVITACAVAASSYGARSDATLTLSSATLSSSWKESWLTGSVRFAGTVSAPAQLEAVVRPVGRAGSPLAAVQFSADSSFSRVMRLPSRPLPGHYRLTINGTSGGAHVTASRDLILKAPTEGIIDRAFVSLKPSSGPINTAQGSQTELWAHFHFVVAPKSKKVRIAWHDPSFRWEGIANKAYSGPDIKSFVRATGGLKLERGVWFVYLWSSDKVVKRVRVRVA